MGLRIEIELENGRVVLRPAGELDIATVNRLREAVVDTISAGHADIVVDLAGVTFIDSSGLGVLVGAMKRCAHAGGRLMVVGADAPAVASALRASGLSRVVPSGTMPDDGLAALQG